MTPVLFVWQARLVRLASFFVSISFFIFIYIVILIRASVPTDEQGQHIAETLVRGGVCVGGAARGLA